MVLGCEVINRSEFLVYLIFVAPWGVAHDEFAYKPGEEELGAEYHGGEGYVEVGRVGDERIGVAVVHVVELDGAYGYDGYKSDEEHQRAEKPEEVHRLGTELACEPERGEVKVAVDEAVKSEFARAVFACLMVDYLLAYASEAGIFGEIRDVTMHVAVDLDVLDDLIAVGFESAVEVVEVLDAADTACRGIEQLGGYGLGEGVVTFLLPSADEVVAVLGDHAVEFRDLVRRVLKIGIHGDDHTSAGTGEACVERRGFAVVAAERYAVDAGVGGTELPDHVP